MKPITEIAEALGVPADRVRSYGPTKAKIDTTYLDGAGGAKKGKLILVTGISPTPAGEGKSTTTVGLGDALNRIGKNAMICLREPSLGPCFGVKGGAAGGGYAQVVPMEDINLHFTGDFHAITSAHNLLSALLDNHIYWGNDLGMDARRIAWRRVVDLNDRALRSIVGSLGGVANGFPRETGFDITVASEVMAIFCLANDLDDLQSRIGNIIVGETRGREPITATDLKGAGPMTVLLKEAIMPNLVQTLEHTPAFVHGGPFANIAHGCNSVSATRSALSLTDYVVTEAGFGSDLGAEKFFNIKCRSAGLAPDAVVLVATVRALKMHGGVARDELGTENVPALREGCANLLRHIENIKGFGVPVVVGINRFISDTDAEIALLEEVCAANVAEAIECTHWADGGAGAEALAAAIVDKCEEPNKFDFLYPDDLGLWDKIETIATRIYRAGSVSAPDAVRRQLEGFEKRGYGNLPVCMAKTQMSFSADPAVRGAPTGFDVHVREVRLAAGAGFVVAVCGNIMTMPGLPKVPAANSIHLNNQGQIEGLF
jgi:formate--tetrahydrofolate ligase